MATGKSLFRFLKTSDLVLFDPRREAHLELYLDTRLGTSGFADGASLSTWTDFSGNSPTRDAITQVASGYTDPLFWSTTSSKLTPKGKPTVEWGLQTVAPGNILASRNTFVWPDLALRGYTFHWYGLINSKTSPVPYPFVNQAWFGPTNKIASFAGQNLFDGGGGFRQYGLVDNAGGGAPHRFNDLSTIAGGWHLHTIIWPSVFNNTVPMKYYLDGVQIAQSAGPANFDLGGGVGNNFYSLGNLWNGNTTISGKQGFALWYSDTQAQATINKVMGWCRIVWGIS